MREKLTALRAEVEGFLDELEQRARLNAVVAVGGRGAAARLDRSGDRGARSRRSAVGFAVRLGVHAVGCLAFAHRRARRCSSAASRPPSPGGSTTCARRSTRGPSRSLNASAERVVGVPVETRERLGPLLAPSRRGARGRAAGRDRPHVRGLRRARRRDVLRGLRGAEGQRRATSRGPATRASSPRASRAAAPPPPSGIVLGALTWAVHHPGDRGRAGAAVLRLRSGVVAVASRRRPRSRI